MNKIDLTGRVAIVTGAASGLGRAEALALAAQGADLVLTDLQDMSSVAAEITALGSKAIEVQGDISSWGHADTLVHAAVDNLGRLDIVVNNAGITRDAMIFNLTEENWDLVIDIHLKGHAALIRAATAYWRNYAKQTSAGQVYGRIINTASEAALLGGPGQPNYSAAKAGIVALTLGAARAMEKYGVTANAICPRARTGMTEAVFTNNEPAEGIDPLDPSHVARVVTTLASEAATGVTGRTFVTYGRMLAVVAEPQIESSIASEGESLTFDEIADHLTPYQGRAINGQINPQLKHLEQLSAQE